MQLNESITHAAEKVNSWRCCPKHAGVKGNDRADRLAGKATVTSGLRLGRSRLSVEELEILHTVERGSARRFSLKGRERTIVSQTNIGTVSKAALGKLLRDGVEVLWLFRVCVCVCVCVCVVCGVWCVCVCECVCVYVACFVFSVLVFVCFVVFVYFLFLLFFGLFLLFLFVCCGCYFGESTDYF